MNNPALVISVSLFSIFIIVSLPLTMINICLLKKYTEKIIRNDLSYLLFSDTIEKNSEKKEDIEVKDIKENQWAKEIKINIDKQGKTINIESPPRRKISNDSIQDEGIINLPVNNLAKTNLKLQNISDSPIKNMIMENEAISKTLRELDLEINSPTTTQRRINYVIKRNQSGISNLSIILNKMLPRRIASSLSLVTNVLEEIKTLKDLNSLRPRDAIINDKRTYCNLLYDFSIDGNLLLKLLFKTSILDPLWSRFIYFLLYLNLILTFNALFLTDDIIDDILINRMTTKVFLFLFNQGFNISHFEKSSFKFNQNYPSYSFSTNLY